MLTFFLKNFQFFSAAWKSSLFILIRYISKFLKISTAFLCFFEKNLPLHQPYHRLGTVFGHFKLKSNPPKGGLHSPTTEVISKTSPSCVATFRKNSKKSSPHHWLSRLPPCFVTPCLNFFQKYLSLHCWLSLFPCFLYHPQCNFLKKSSSTTDYRKSTPILLHPVLLFFEKSPLHQWLSQEHPIFVSPCLHFFLKNFRPPPLIIAKTYQKRYPLFEFFEKSSRTVRKSQ